MLPVADMGPIEWTFVVWFACALLLFVLTDSQQPTKAEFGRAIIPSSRSWPTLFCSLLDRSLSRASSWIARRPAKLAVHMIQVMSGARRLGREIAPIVGGDRPMQGHAPRDIDAGARELLELARVGGL